VSLSKTVTNSTPVLLTTSSGTLSVPSSVTVGINQSTATFAATTGSVSEAQNVTVTGSLNGINQSTTIALTVTAQPSSLSCSPGKIGRASCRECIVTLTAAAPAGGTAVILYRNNTSIQIPASVGVSMREDSA